MADNTVDNIIFGLEIFTGVVCGLIGGTQAYMVAKNIQKIKQNNKYKKFVSNHDMLSANEFVEATYTESFIPKKQHMVLLEGKAVSGAFLVENAFKGSDKETLQKNLSKIVNKKDKKRHLLFARHAYKMPGIFGETQFNEDIEAQNFYVLEDSSRNLGASKLDKVLVHPHQKTSFFGYEAKKTMSAEEKLGSAVLNRMINTFLMGSTSYLYNRYSQCVYEGDTLNVFGLASYNGLTDRWELTKPIAFLQGELAK